MAKVGRLVKELMVQELMTELKNRPNFFVATPGRLSAVEADTLRKRLRTVQAKVLVIKRTLGLRGMSALDLTEMTALFAGSVALVLPGQEIIPAAKLLVDFAKADREKLNIRGGWIDGQLLDQQALEELASLPPKPQLAAQLIGAIELPLTELVMVLESTLGELAWILEEVSKKRPAPHEAAPAATAEKTTPSQEDAKTQAQSPEPNAPTEQPGAQTQQEGSHG